MQLTRLNRPLVIFSILSNFLMLAAPLHMMQVYNRVLVSGSQSTLFYITLIAIVAFVLFGACETIRSRIAQRQSARYVVDRAEALFSACSNLSDKARSNEILRHFNTTKQFLASKAHIGIYDLPFAPLFLLLLFAVHYQIGLLTLVGAGILVGLALINKVLSEEDQNRSSEANSNAISFASTILARGEDIKAMGLMPPLIERWGGLTQTALNAQENATRTTARIHGISRATRQILQILIMAWGAFLVLGGDLSGGLIFAASMISGRALQPIEQVIGGWDSIVRASNASRQVEEFLDKQGQAALPIQQPAPTGRLDVEDISVSIGDIKLLDGLSFDLQPGEFLGVVGPSGAGKSTLARVLAGAVHPTAGRVLLDGCDRRNWPENQWGRYVGYVGQDLQLFPVSIAENIARMAIEPDENRVVEAAQATGVHELINSFPDGYMSQVSGSGIRLSGGQVQRIALARAIYSRPALLVLDEANAHLDLAGEERLVSILLDLKRQGVTIVSISQRGHLNQLADKIISLKAGRCSAMRLNRPTDLQPDASRFAPRGGQAAEPPARSLGRTAGA